jgi:hypothetical protein
LSDARVLVKITFEDPTEDPRERKKEFEEFLQWRPGNLLEVKWGTGREDQVMMHGFFKTNSSSAIMSMPMELWDSLPRKPAYEFISVIRSFDLRNKLLQSDKPIASAPALPKPDHSQSAKRPRVNIEQ